MHDCCDIHDWEYFMGETLADKHAADDNLLMNMLTTIETKSSSIILKWFRDRRALLYYEAVRDFGGNAFWNGKERKGAK
jgi:hypothetical protein